jgi:hypothetical protein
MCAHRAIKLAADLGIGTESMYQIMEAHQRLQAQQQAQQQAQEEAQQQARQHLQDQQLDQPAAQEALLDQQQPDNQHEEEDVFEDAFSEEAGEEEQQEGEQEQEVPPAVEEAAVAATPPAAAAAEVPAPSAISSAANAADAAPTAAAASVHQPQQAKQAPVLPAAKSNNSKLSFKAVSCNTVGVCLVLLMVMAYLQVAPVLISGTMPAADSTSTSPYYGYNSGVTSLFSALRFNSGSAVPVGNNGVSSHPALSFSTVSSYSSCVVSYAALRFSGSSAVLMGTSSYFSGFTSLAALAYNSSSAALVGNSTAGPYVSPSMLSSPTWIQGSTSGYSKARVVLVLLADHTADQASVGQCSLGASQALNTALDLDLPQATSVSRDLLFVHTAARAAQPPRPTCVAAVNSTAGRNTTRQHALGVCAARSNGCLSYAPLLPQCLGRDSSSDSLSAASWGISAPGSRCDLIADSAAPPLWATQQLQKSMQESLYWQQLAGDSAMQAPPVGSWDMPAQAAMVADWFYPVGFLLLAGIVSAVWH